MGWLDERPVTYGEVGRYIRTREPEAFFRNLEALVLERVTRLEAGHLGVDVPAAILNRGTARRMQEWEARVRAASRAETGEEIDPALWLQRVAGVSLARFREEVRRHTEVELLQDRLLRYEALTARRVEVSLLVVEDPDEGARLAGQIRDGADFDALARARSRHASAGEGGRVPFPLLREDFNDAEVARALFEAPEGTVVGPLATSGGDRTFHQVYRVEARHAPLRGDYAALRGAVEKDLENRPVPVGEYERWRRRILLRHGFAAAPAPGDSG